jgi:FMN phosphatase YigB (HAD superfamily)
MNTILFDLDGTLLPMDQEMFIKLYFKQLVTHFAPFGIAPEAMMAGVNEGTKAMVLNDGSMTNEERFWSEFSKHLGPDVRNLEPEFEKFYQTGFHQAKASTSTSELTQQVIQKAKDKGFTIIIATNPLFPKVATHGRIGWAGFSPEDVSYITTYETSSYCKPNLEYYREILDTIGKDPSECMMVGNDVKEDMGVSKLGMKRYLITDCLINTNNDDISDIPHGSMQDFLTYLDEITQ